jgi:hypothetical protein
MSDSDKPRPDFDLTRRTLLRRAALAAGGAATFGLAPALHAAKPVKHIAPTAPPTPEDITSKNIDDIVKGFDKIPGVVTLYRKDNDLYAELTPAQLDTPFLLQATRETGTAGVGGVAGDPLADIVFRFHQANDQIYLVEPNVTFRAAPHSPEATSLKRSFAESYLASFPVMAYRTTPEETKTVAAITDQEARLTALRAAATGILIHIPTLFSTDVPNFTQGMPGYNIDSDQTYLEAVKNFSGNLVVRTSYSFTGHPQGGFFGQGADTSSLADSRGFVEEVSYNLFPLKDTGYKPRFYDDRIGYFTEDYETFTDDTSPDNIRRMILRWNLVKKDPKATVSAPVTPVTFWIDNATPLRYRDAIKEGVLYWNAAFEPLGYKDAVVCEIMPDDADWDPADMTHNVVRWTSSYGAGYAVAQFRHNPLTGEILNAAITVDASMARFTNLEYPTTVLTGEPAQSMPGLPGIGQTGSGVLLTPAQVAAQIINYKPTPVPTNRCFCNYGPGAAQAATFGWDCFTGVEATPGGDPMPTLEEYTHRYLRSVVSHESGHCLGLRHNFKGSTMLTETQLQDSGLTSQYGVTASVMDYLPANVPPVGGKLADIWTPCVGPYDKWAIAYGYTDFGSDSYQEVQGLAALASRSQEFGHAFASDEDADALDPTITRFDLGQNPLDFRVAMVGRAHDLLSNLEYRYPQPGQAYYQLTRVFVRSLNEYAGQALEVSRFVGGIVTDRNHKGDAGSVLPVQPVLFADQRRALQTLCQYVLSDSSLQFSPSLLAKLEENPVPYSDRLPQSDNQSQDLSMLDIISNVQATGLYAVLNHDTLNRLETNEFRSNPSQKPLTVLETMQTVTGVVWSEFDGKPHAIPPLRRRLQRTYLDAVIGLADPGPNQLIFGPLPNDDSGAFAVATLRTLAEKMVPAERLTQDPSTAAHLSESRLRILRFLHAQTVV